MALQEKVSPIHEGLEPCSTVSTEDVNLVFTSARIRASLASPEDFTFQLLDNNNGQVVCRIAVTSAGSYFVSDFISSVRGVDVRNTSPQEILSILQQTCADPSAWPLALEFDRERVRSGIPSKPSDANGTDNARITQAVNATEIAPKMRTDPAPTQARLTPPRGYAGPQLFITPRLTVFAAIVVPLLVVGMCGYSFFYGLTLQTYNMQETTDAEIAFFINFWTNFLGVLITAMDSLVQLAALSGLTAVFATLASFQFGNGFLEKKLLSKAGVSLLVVTSISSALSGLSIQRQPSRIIPTMTEADFSKYSIDDYNLNSQSELKYYSQEYALSSSAATMLRQAMYPYVPTKLYCDNTNVTMEPIGVVYRFYLNDWQKVMLPTGLSPLEAYTVPGFEGLQELPSANTSLGQLNDILETHLLRGPIFNKTAFTTDEAYQLEELFIRNVYVYAEAMSAEAAKAGDTTFVSAMEGLRDDSVEFLSANDVRDAPSGTNPTEHIQQFMSDYFDSVTQWATVMKINSSEIKIEYALFNISSTINFTSVTVPVPQDRGQLYRILDEVNGELVEQDTAWSGSGDVVYEIPVARECASRTCSIQNRGYVPDPRVSKFGECTEDYPCTVAATRLSHLVFGFGRRIEGDSLEELYLPDDKSGKLRKAVLRNPRDSHVMTMGRLGVRIEDLSAKFGAQCNYTYGCEGISYELNTPENTPKQFLVLHASEIPAEIPAFSLVNNSAQPTRLVSRYTYGQRVEYEILLEYNFPVFNYSYQVDENCSAPRGLMLFQNARLLDPLPADKGDSLAFQGNQELFDVAITLPVALFALSCFGCLVTMTLIVRTFRTTDRIDLRLLRQPTAVLQAHLNGSDFPRKLLSLDVQVRPGESELPLDSLQVSGVEFVQPHDPRQRVIFQPTFT